MGCSKCPGSSRKPTWLKATCSALSRMPCPIWKVGRPDARRPDHPLFAGRPGTIGTRAGNFCLQTADFLLVIGSRLNLRQISYNWARFAPAAVVVQVDIDPAELAKPFVRPALAVEADARDFLHTLAQQALAHTLPDFSDWARWCRALPSRYLNAPVLVIVLANNGYLSIRQTHESFFCSAVGATPASGVDFPDYQRLAFAYGVSAVRIAGSDDLPLMDPVLSQDGPYLIQIDVDPDQPFEPRLKSRMLADGTFATPELDDMFPFLPAEEVAAVRLEAAALRLRPRIAT